MLKLSASVMKKVPLPGVEYSSFSCSAGIEVELPSDAAVEEIQARLKGLYALLELAVDEQLSAPRQVPHAGKKAPAQRNAAGPGTRNGNGRKATEAQLKAIDAIARSRKVGDSDLKDLVESQFGVSSTNELSIG